ncbi:MAG TPA: YcbK family protein [Desulfosarcina sp.]|nr:YcbK family protein [Desulfosarcina sp.]
MNSISTLTTTRRNLLKLGASTALTAVFSHPALAALTVKHRILSFYNIHTGESLKTCYHANGKLIHRAVDRINHIMRDYRTGEIKPVDPQLLDVLHRLMSAIECTSPISIISGYRSPSTNAALRKATKGVALKSLHMEGRAIDIRIPGYDTEAVRAHAIGLKSGGVGYYPESDFVHLDTGPVKIW